MKTKCVFLFLATVLLFSFPLGVSVRGASSAQEELSETWDEIGRALRNWADRAQSYFGFSMGMVREERPLISLMLRNRDKLGLSAEQVRALEQLRSDFQKEAIRKDADRRVAEMDLGALLEAPSVDMAKAEAKVREIERLRGDVRIARIQAIEKAKQQLSADQRKKLQELLSDREFTSIQPRREH